MTGPKPEKGDDSRKMLSPEDLEEATEFIQESARPVDKAVFAFEFEDGSAQAVLDAVADYQNPDGGLGHGIEPDFRLHASSPMATSVGLQYCTAVHADENDQVVQSAIEYLLDTYDAVDGYWPATPKEVNDEPHAPWWHVESMDPPPDEDWANPSAEIVGYLHQYSACVPREFLKQVTDRAEENITQFDTLEGWYRYNLLCWQRAMPYLPNRLTEYVYGTIAATFDRYPIDEEHFGEVGVVWLAPTPDSILSHRYPERVNEQLDKVIAQQADDGGWWTSWEWGQYEESWEIAKREWAGKLTVETLSVLDAHSRLP